MMRSFFFSGVCVGAITISVETGDLNITSSDGDDASLIDNGDDTFDVVIEGEVVGTITQTQIDEGGWIVVAEPVVDMTGDTVVLTSAGYVIYVGDVFIETDVEVLSEANLVGTQLPYDATAYADSTLSVRFSYTTGAETFVISKTAREAPLKLIQFRDSYLLLTGVGDNGPYPLPSANRKITMALRYTGATNIQGPSTGTNIGIISLSGVKIMNGEYSGGNGNIQLTSDLTSIGSVISYPVAGVGGMQTVSLMVSADLDGGLPGGETFVVWINRTGTWQRLGGHSTTSALTKLYPYSMGSQNGSTGGGAFDIHNHMWWSNVAMDPATNWQHFFNADGSVKNLGAEGVVNGISPLLYMVGDDFLTGDNRGTAGNAVPSRTPVNVINQ